MNPKRSTPRCTVIKLVEIKDREILKSSKRETLPRQQSRKTLRLTSFRGHTKITSIYVTTISEKDQNVQKRSYATKEKKKALQRNG